MASIEFKDVARLLSCREFVEAEGLPIRGGRTRCPLHGGRNFNFALLDDGRAYCHVCHRASDVVQLAAAVWHMSQRDAAVELNQRFHLGLTETMPTAERMQRLSERDRRRQDAQNRLNEARAEAVAAWDLVKQCQADTPEYAEAVKHAQNADVWVQFKRVEAKQAGVNVGGVSDRG